LRIKAFTGGIEVILDVVYNHTAEGALAERVKQEVREQRGVRPSLYPA